MNEYDTNLNLKNLLKKLLGNELSTHEQFTILSRRFEEEFLTSEAEQIQLYNDEEEDFRESSYERWKPGFDLLLIFRRFCIELGNLFRKEFCKYDIYMHDPLLGVLMRQHAHSCRIMGEVEVLLRNGYPDGALARWRTLHEIAVTSIIIQKYGKQAAEDFIRYGLVEAVRGMDSYQETANDMQRIPYSTAEIDSAKKIKDEILKNNTTFNSRNGWAIPYAKVGKFEKLQEVAGLAKWKNDYKWASQNVHANYREMQVLLGMSEAKEDGLLAGPSNSGYTDPAQYSAIALGQTTSVFLTCYMNKKDYLIDFSFISICLPTMNQMIQDIGKRFFEIESLK